MGFLSAQDEEAVKKEFERLGGSVKLTVFAAELGPGTNAQTVRLMQEGAALSDKLSVSGLNPHIDRDRAPADAIHASPAAVGRSERDHATRLLGIPAGYEFSNLIDSIIAVSNGEAALHADTKAALADLPEAVTIKVFSTPT